VQMAAEKGYIMPQLNVIRELCILKVMGFPHDRDKSIHWFLQAANQENAYNIGLAYYHDQGDDKDIDQAFI
jgi:TPR repeat protein